MCQHCDKALRATAYLSLQTTLLGRDGYSTEGNSEIPAQSHPANELRFKHFSFHLHNDHMLTRKGERGGREEVWNPGAILALNFLVVWPWERSLSSLSLSPLVYKELITPTHRALVNIEAGDSLRKPVESQKGRNKCKSLFKSPLSSKQSC